jgi:hypothetical protein
MTYLVKKAQKGLDLATGVWDPNNTMYSKMPIIPPTVEIPPTASLLPINQRVGSHPNKLIPRSTPGVDLRLDASGKDKKLQADKDNRILGERQLPDVRPLVDVANYLQENNAINRIRKTQLARKNLYQNAPSLAVRPIQDLSPEILAAQDESVTQNRSEYAGSDPVMNMLSKNIATAQRGKMRGDFIAGRADNLVKERARFDEQTRQNQQAAADTAAKNVDREQEFQDYKTGVNTATLEAKKQLNTNFLNQVGMNLDTAANYALQAKAAEEANKRQTFEDRVAMAYAEPNAARREELLAGIQTDYPQGYTASLLPSYYRAQAGGLKGSFIGNLMTRGLFGKKMPTTP